MADNPAETLEAIFQMMEPADFVGAQAVALGKKSTDVNVVKQVLDIIYNAGATGAMPMAQMVPKLNETLTKATGDDKTGYKKVIHVFNSDNLKVDSENAAKGMSLGKDGTTVTDSTTFDQIIGRTLKTQKMGIILTNSPYLTPAVRNAERCEIFLNSIPSVHASRMVPYLDVEFAFNRVIDDTTAPHETFGLSRFLLGGNKPEAGSPTEKLVQARVSLDKATGIETTTVGMELFTSPQTLVPAIDAAGQAGRYADVIDPMRPSATIETFVVSVTPTVGLYSYKKGTLTMRLHDRSRLAEIADLVRPQVFQNAQTAPTVWITYGWRYPYEPASKAGDVGSRSYSDFINNNMLVREAYGIANSQFSFDQTGQVNVTLELWTKGISELRTVRITDTNDGMSKTMKDLEALAERITKYANALNFGKADGPSKEIRAFQLIESAERGVFPDMSADEIQKSIAALKASILKANPDSDEAKNLAKALDDFYKSSDKKNLDLKKQVTQQATKVAQAKFDEVLVGADPFLYFEAKNTKNKSETQVSADHPFAKVIDAYNKGASNVKLTDFQKHLVSLGKLFSVFVAHALETTETIDEMQLFFHQFNDHAGLAAATNISEFPIDMPVFFDQYRELVERKGTERLTLEEFLKLIVDAQVTDERAIGYGFREFFDPYDPASPNEPKLKKGEEGNYEATVSGLGAQRGPFVKPVIDIYAETTYATDGQGNDLLQRFELQQAGPDSEVARTGHLTRIMRIHIFDKQNNPYKAQTAILKGQGQAVYTEVSNDYAKAHTPDSKQTAILQLMKGVDVDSNKVLITTDLTAANGAGPYTTIKQLVSKTMPSIIYGANGTMVTTANLASKQDALLAVTQMQSVAKKAGKPSSIGQPNGGGQGGLPLRIIPAQLSVNSMGCPLLTYGQLFFVDFGTGTTVDNIYTLTGLTHTISPGKFDTQMKFSFVDAYGRYEGAPTKLDYIKAQLTNAPAKK